MATTTPPPSERAKVCGRCKLRLPLVGGRTTKKFYWVCAGCSEHLYAEERGQAHKRKGGGPAPVVCPAKGLAAGYDPRFQVAPGTVVEGPFSRDWAALRRGGDD